MISSTKESVGNASGGDSVADSVAAAATPVVKEKEEEEEEEEADVIMMALKATHLFSVV